MTPAERDELIVRAYRAGAPVAQICGAARISGTTLYRVLRRTGLEPSRLGDLRMRRAAELITAAHDAGRWIPTQEVATASGLTPRSVQVVRSRLQAEGRVGYRWRDYTAKGTRKDYA